MERKCQSDLQYDLSNLGQGYIIFKTIKNCVTVRNVNCPIIFDVIDNYGV